LFAFSGIGSGCYLGHVAGGQARLLWARQPVAELESDPATPASLRERLDLVAEVRAFATTLGLDVGGRYTSYVPWPGDALVTSVVATRPGEVEPVTSWFPIVGSVPYRGWFDAERAEGYAASLREDGLDVCVVPVRAYSTLGWFDDPLTGPMLRQEPAVLVETILHELLHATVFVSGDAEFNEGVAAFFGEEARMRFYAARDGAGAGERERAAVARQRRLRAEILALRRRVESLYAEHEPGGGRDAPRAEREAEARRRLATLAPPGTDAEAWAAGFRLNDACLALSGTYHADTPALERVLAAQEGDLVAFLAAVRRAAEAEDPRAALLE
jgi:predicted aminopeptidase